MIKAVIFDLDGLLIDSEPLWQEAEQEVFTSLGVPITRAIVDETTGLRSDETVRYWYARHPWPHYDEAAVVAHINTVVLRLITSRVRPMPGVHEAFAVCRQLSLAVAICSSSSSQIIEAAIAKIGLTGQLDAVHSAETEPRGKPDPAVYLRTAELLRVPPQSCLALEDSISGVRSALSAGMKCIAVPEPASAHYPDFRVANRILGSLKELTPELISDL